MRTALLCTLAWVAAGCGRQSPGADLCAADGGVTFAYKPLSDGGFDEVGCSSDRTYLGDVSLLSGKGVCCSARAP